MSSNVETEHPSGSPLPELARAITTGAVRLAAATAAWLRLVAEFDARGGWHGVGINSCGHWLAWQCGMSPVTAREHVRVARALRGLPTDRGGVRRRPAVLRQGAGADPHRRPRLRGRAAGVRAVGDRLADRAVLPGLAARRRRRRARRPNERPGGRAVLRVLDRRRGLPDPEDPDARRSRHRRCWPRSTPWPNATPAGNARRTRRPRPGTSRSAPPAAGSTAPSPSAASRTRRPAWSANAPRPAASPPSARSPRPA